MKKAQALGLALLTLLPSVSVLANTADFQVGLGPFVGGGTASNGAKVRNSSGYSVTLDREWALNSSGLALGPHAEFTNSFINTRRVDDDVTSISTYDNRIVAAGLRLSQILNMGGSFAPNLYLTTVAGRAFTKLSVDSSSDKTYLQDLYGQISGNYAAAELGAVLPLKGNFGLAIAVLGSQQSTNQAKASGSRSGTESTEDGLRLVEEKHERGDGSLDEHIVLKTMALKVSLSLGF